MDKAKVIVAALLAWNLKDMEAAIVAALREMARQTQAEHALTHKHSIAVGNVYLNGLANELEGK